ncbi:MAG: NAD(P)/FAD-dependent oxidoreductase [Polyangiales bacterium]
MTASRLWDVIVVGAGPAGSTAAALLAGKGFEVLVLEKEEFPRFHIGESLLPAGLPVLHELGIEPDEDVFMFKRGAQFLRESTGLVSSFDFAGALAGPPRHAWHVERASFDTMLRDKAAARGALVRHGVTVTDMQVDTDSASVQTSYGTERARFIVDASGQDRFVAKLRRATVPYSQFGKAAAFAHFDGLSDEAIEVIGPGNDIRIMMVEDGWLWVIHLPGRRLSVGLVSKKPGVSGRALDREIAVSPLLRCLTHGTEATDARLVSGFSYRNDAKCGPRYACIGDAACFLDPVFSSGVSLALLGAEGLVERLAPALQNGTESNEDLYRDESAKMDEGYRAFALLINRFYNTKLVDNVVLNSPAEGELRASITSMLAGDVWREGNAFRDMLFRSRIQL